MASLAHRMANLRLYSCVSAVIEVTAYNREFKKRQRRQHHMKYLLLAEFEVQKSEKRNPSAPIRSRT